MKKIAFLAFLPLGFATLASLSNTSPLSVAKHVHTEGGGLNETHPNTDYIDAYVVKTEVEASGNVYLTITGDPDLESGTANAPVYHCNDAEVNYLDNVIISTGGVDYVLRDIITSTQPSYNKFTRPKCFYFTINTTVAEAYASNRIGGKFSNTSHITIKEGFTIPAYSYGSVDDATGITPTYIKTPATSVFSDPRDSGVSIVYNVDEEIDLTFCEENTDAGRIANYKTYAGLGTDDPVTGLAFGSDQTKTSREREDKNANVVSDGLVNGVLNGHKIKINGKCIAGEREDRVTDKHSYLNLDYWTQWWHYELFVNGAEEGGVQTVEVKEGAVFPCYKTKSVGGWVNATDTVETIPAKTRLVYRVSEDAKFVKNSKGNFIRDHGEDYETTIKDGKVRFVPWDNGTRFLQFNLTNSDYQDYTLANQAVVKDLADKYEFVDHIEYYDEAGNLVPHNGSANDSLIKYFDDPAKDTGGKYDIGIRVKQDGVTQDPFTNVRYIKFKAGMQFPSYCYMAYYTNNPADSIRAPEFAWSRPDMSAYVLEDDIIFYATGVNNEFVNLDAQLTDISETDIDADELIHNIGKWKPDSSGHAVKNFDQNPDTLRWVEDEVADKQGLYFSHTPTDPFVANSASEVRFYLPDNGYKSETKTYIVKSWSFDYCLTDINTVKGTEGGTTYVGNNYEDAEEASSASSETTSYMLQYIADKVSAAGTLAYYCYDANLVADGKWHTCTINQYCPTVYGLNIKLFKFQGEFVIANVQCDIDTHVDTLNKVDGTPATCTADGYKDCYRCSVCGKYFTDNTAATEITDYEAWKLDGGKIAATGHEYGEVTFTWNGDQCTASKSCTHTGCTDTQTETKTGTWHQVLAATCTAPETGYYEVTFTTVCTDTKQSDTAPRGEALGHDWGNPQYVWNVDVCTASRECSTCGETESEEASLSNGKVTFVTDTPATCSASGSGHYEATFDGEDFEGQRSGDVVIPVTQHTLEHMDGKPATCTEDGYKEYYVCKDCGAYFMDKDGTKGIDDLETWKTTEGENGGKLPATGKHASIKVDGKAATCSEAGYKDCYKCNGCNQYFEDEACTQAISDYNAWKAEGGKGYIAPVAHSVEKVNGKAATCDGAGYKDCYKCTTCNKYFEDEACTKPIADYEAWKTGDGKINALVHEYVHVDEVKATKDKEGVKEHYKCSHCGKLFVKEGDTYVEKTAADLVIPKVKSGGCGGSIIAGGSVALVAALSATALLITKKKKSKKDENK